MMMKGPSSPSTFLYFLVGLTVLLCVVNEAQDKGWGCYRRLNYETAKERRIEDCTWDIKCKAGRPYQGCLTSTTGPALKDCACSSKNEDRCEDGDCFCKADFCNDDNLAEKGKGSGRGGAASPVLAYSTLLSASALVIITSTLF